MPKLANQENLMQFQVGTFGFSAVDPAELKEGEYTLVCFVMDLSFSTDPFRNMMVESFIACIRKLQGEGTGRPHPLANTIMIRLIVFGSDIEERIGLQSLMSLDCDKLRSMDWKGMGMTACADAIISAGEGVVKYADELHRLDIEANALIIVMTDGINNAGKYNGCLFNGMPQPTQARYDETMSAVAKAIREPRQGEHLESMCSILIGVNMAEFESSIRDFHDKGGFTEPLISLENADDPTKWDAVAEFFYQSVSSSSQARGTGSKSASIANVI